MQIRDLELGTDGWIKEGVIRTPSPNHGPEFKYDQSLLVLHDTAGNVENNSARDWLCNPKSRVSAHFVISVTGMISQLVSCRNIAWHAGRSIWKGRDGCNNYAIGIEHDNPGQMPAISRTAWGQYIDPEKYRVQQARSAYHPYTYWMAYPEAQLAASVSLAMALHEAYHFVDIVGHYHISPKRKVDINPLFPLDQYRQKVFGEKEEVLTISIKEDAIFRQWPSFYSTNHLSQDLQNDIELRRTPVIKVGKFKVLGDEIPRSLAINGAESTLWYRVRVTEGIEGWVWSGHTEAE